MPHRFIILLLFSLLLFSEFAGAQSCNYSMPGYVTNRFADNEDGTVTDKVTGLIWQRCSLGTEWNSALNICEGYISSTDWKTTLVDVQLFNASQSSSQPNDWRLPNVKELASLTNIYCTEPAIDLSIFPGTGSGYWTSTPYISSVSSKLDDTQTFYSDEHMVWMINFLTGVEAPDRISSDRAARLVRDGESSQ